VEIFATNVMLLGSAAGAGGGRQGAGPAPEGRAPQEFPEGAAPAGDSFEDDIPF
jgi:hypothetical protein